MSGITTAIAEAGLSPMRVVSFITEPGLIRRILDHLAHRAEEGQAPPPSQPEQT